MLLKHQQQWRQRPPGDQPSPQALSLHNVTERCDAQRNVLVNIMHLCTEWTRRAHEGRDNGTNPDEYAFCVQGNPFSIRKGLVQPNARGSSETARSWP